MTNAFFGTIACRSRAHCAACRSRAKDGTEFRAGVDRIFHTGTEFECPFGAPWGEAPPPAPTAVPRPPPGPGTELNALLKKFWIGEAPGCRCTDHMAEMDAKGVDWCAANVEVIAGWLVEEAERRGWPGMLGFLKVSGRLLVKAAIRRARKRQVK